MNLAESKGLNHAEISKETTNIIESKEVKVEEKDNPFLNKEQVAAKQQLQEKLRKLLKAEAQMKDTHQEHVKFLPEENEQDSKH